MAGLSFLYAFFNLYSVGGPGIPNMEEAMMDIESCLAVLDYLTRKSNDLIMDVCSQPARVPSAQACHETMQTLSKAILEQLSNSKPASNANSPSGRVMGMSRAAPISSSRDDPLPTPNESFPAPLPAVTLPYELSLLDNLFVNPMSSHKKASEYTNGNKNRCAGKNAEGQQRSGDGGAISGMTISAALANTPQGFPPSAFGGTGVTPASGDQSLMGLQAYGLAAQVGGTGTNSLALSGDGTKLVTGNPANANQTMGVGAAPGDTGFDLLSFLMDEEGGLGTGTWDSLDVPADYSLWS